LGADKILVPINAPASSAFVIFALVVDRATIT